MTGTRRLAVRPIVAAVAAASALVMLAGCGSSGTGGGTAATGTSAPPAVPVDYAKAGPYKVGMTTLTLGDRDVLVFYPADPAALASATRVTSYSSGEAFSPELRATVASLVPEFVQDIPLDAYKDAKINGEKPFPVVLHSHGFGGSNRFAQQHLQHLASWGFVAAAPDHKSRNLAAVATGKIGAGASDTDDLTGSLDLLTRVNNEAGPLERGMDLEKVGVEGHSAGGGAAVRVGSDPRIDTIIGQAPAPPVRVDAGDAALPAEERAAKAARLLAEQTPPAKPVYLIAAEKDSAIPLDGIRAEFAWLQTPKALLVIKGAGHNAFTDTCKPIKTQGGLLKYSETLGPAFAPLLRLGSDGCNPGDPDPQSSTDLFNHASVAWYRFVFGRDATDVSLRNEYLAATFPAAFGSQIWCWTSCAPDAAGTSTTASTATP